MTGVFARRRNLDRDTHTQRMPCEDSDTEGDNCAKMEAEIRVVLPQIKEGPDSQRMKRKGRMLRMEHCIANALISDS